MAEAPAERSPAEALRGTADSEREAVVARLRELVELDSPSGEPTLLVRTRDTLASRLEELGAKVEVVPGPAGDHLRARMASAGDGPGLLMLAHYDTVWPSGESCRRPFFQEGDTARGPGVLDMKGGLVALELALRLVDLAGLSYPQPVEIVIVADEEVSSPDGRRVVGDAAGRARAAIGLEPAHADGELKTARRGVVRVGLRVRGREAHSGLDAVAGVSATEELLDQLDSLRAHLGGTDGVELNIGRLEGGTRANVIAGHALAEVGFRISNEDGQRAVQDWLGSVRARRPGAVTDAKLLSFRPVWEGRPDSRLLSHVGRLGTDLGQHVLGRPAGGAGDANLTAAAGIATLDGLGPWGGGAHALDEHVSVRSILNRAELLAALLSSGLPAEL